MEISRHQMESKRATYKILSVIFILLALYLAFNSFSYMWTVYNSLYEQVGLIKTIFSFFLTVELGIIAVGLLLMPISTLLREEKSIRRMLQSNFLALLGNVLIIEVAFPTWNGLIVLLLSKFF